MSAAEHNPDSRRALLAERLRRRTEAARTQRLPRRPAETAPLSAAQERIWLLYEFDPLSPVFNRPAALRLSGKLDVACLQQTLDEILRRHEALRTVFPTENGEPLQRILPPTPVPFELVSIDPAAADPAAEARRIVAVEAREIFDLHNGPLFRTKLLALAPDDHVLLVLMHHIVFDGWSENVFLHELASIYGSLSRGEPTGLPELEIQYADFARWQRQRLEAGSLQKQIDYWVDALAAAPAALTLPRDDEAAGGRRGEGASVTLRLDGNLRAELEALCRARSVSLFMLLLGLFQLLLARHSGQDDIVVGSPIAGRTRVETEALIGCFMNVLLFRTRFPPHLDFQGLLASVRRTVLSAFENQEAPFERVVAALGPERSPDRWPLFQAMFHLRNLPNKTDLEQGEPRIARFEFDSAVIGGLDLSLEVKEHEDGLTCSFSYDATHFARGTIERLADHYQRLLQACAADPRGDVRRTPMLGEAERRRLIDGLNQTRARFSPDRLVHELIDEQAVKTPEAIALVAAGERWSYRRLIRAADHTARKLRSLGAGRGRFVGVCMRRSPQLAAALLGVLKSGAAYVPLEPASPPLRLAGVMEDAGIAVTLADEAGAAVLGDAPGDVVILDSGSFEEAEEPDPEGLERDPKSGVTPEDPAYVMYTSGSSGSPKGVVVPHRAICNHLLHRKEAFPHAAGDRQLQRASCSFDDSVWELFDPWISGACVVMAEPGREADSAYLIDLIQKERINVACFIPSQLAVLAEEESLADCRTLKRVMTGAETLAPAVAADILEKLPGIRLFNGYGPTEATVACSYHECTGDRSLRTSCTPSLRQTNR